MSALPPSVDRMPVQMRKPRAGPLLDTDEAIACGLNYAMQFEFWKREIAPDSMVVRAIEQALAKAGYSIVPTESKREE